MRLEVDLIGDKWIIIKFGFIYKKGGKVFYLLFYFISK